MTFPSPIANQENNWEVFVYPVLTVFISNIILFIICQTVYKRDNSYIDIWWGLSFCLPLIAVWVIRIYMYEQISSPTYRMYLVTILVFVWAFRLAIYLGVRKKTEDYRYKNWRESWEADGDCNYYMKSFFIVFMLQSIFSIIVNLSALFVNIFS